MVIISLLLCAAALTQNVHDIAAAVDHHYDSIRSLQANFAESYRGAGISRSESGTLVLKHPGRMRWDYQQPRAKLFLSDGKTAWFYVPGERQARRAPVKKLDDLRSPLRFLLGHTKLEKEFSGLSLASDVQPERPGNIVLRGIPKGMEDRVGQVLLEITPSSEIARIVIQETDGSSTEFRFSDQKENVEIPDSRFHFAPPPGVEVVEAEELGQ